MHQPALWLQFALMILASNTVAAADDETNQPPLVLAGNSSVLQKQFSLRLAFPPWRLGPICQDFVLRPIQTVPLLAAVTSRGLGPVRFTSSEATDTGSCQSLGTGSLYLENVNITSEAGRRVCACLDRNRFPISGHAATGAIVVIVGQKIVASVEVVATSVTHPTLSVVYWFLGVAIPALVAASLGLLGNRIFESWKNSRRDSENFNIYKTHNRASLESFFRNFFPTLDKEDGQKFAKILGEELFKQDIATNLPTKKRDKLLRLLGRAEHRPVLRYLRKLFPEWLSLISES